MAPKLVLVYFNIPGIAEPIRWALAQSGLEWEDKRLSMEEFSVLKPTLPNGQVPILEVDDYTLPQSMAILRYVGKLGGFYPTGDLEEAKCDAVMDSVTDILIEIQKDLVANYIPTWVVWKNSWGRPRTFTSLSRSGIFDGVPTSIVDVFPKLVALTEPVLTKPKIAEFLDNVSASK